MQGGTTPSDRQFTRRSGWISYGLRRAAAWAGFLLYAGRSHPERGRLHRDVMRLEVVAGGGHTPDSYGWHVDDLLNVGVHYAKGAVVAPEAPAEEEGGLPARAPESSVYRVPRTHNGYPRLQLGPSPMA